MKEPLLPYVVRQGDYLTKLAVMHGFEADDVWNHAKNKELHDLRPDMDVLCPGDILFLPEPERETMSVAGGGENAYTADVLQISVHLVLHDQDGEALANEPCLIQGLGEPLEKSTDGDGGISFSAPVLVREVTIELLRRGLLVPVRIGDLDPLEETSGARMRLAHLRYLTLTDDREIESWELARAIAAFQGDAGLEPTGSLDDATRSALRTAHGS